MIDVVESNSEEIHGRFEKMKLKERAESDRMAANEQSRTDKRVCLEEGSQVQSYWTFPSVGPNVAPPLITNHDQGDGVVGRKISSELHHCKVFT